MKTIMLTEEQERKLLTFIINEKVGQFEPVQIVCNYLDNHYVRADIEKTNEYGEIGSEPIVVALNAQKQPTEQHYSLQQLFDIIEYRFKNIKTDKIERTKFLWQIIKDWYEKKITPNGSLTKY